MRNSTNCPSKILLVDDEPQFLLSSGTVLRSAGIKDVLTEKDSRKVLSLLSEQEVAVIVLDLSMPYVSGAELLEEISYIYPSIPVIVVTAKTELETAVECMKYGAYDYLVKPVSKDRFVSAVKRALEIYSLRNQVSSLKHHLLSDKLENTEAFSEIVTRSKKMLAIFHYMEVIAQTRQPVLITGETGTGKELIARAVHTLSGCEGKFVPVNMAGLDDTMFSDTLFGHKKGAYTGALQSREGMIAQASAGTLFLDEIGDMPSASQVKLLRLLQEQKYYPLGSDLPKQTDARVVVATNHDLQESIGKDIFRKDLYYRLCAHQIHVPPLTERSEDIPVLVDHFLGEASADMKKEKPTIPIELYTLLSTYHYPGNVRELRAMVFDAVARHRSGILSMKSFKETIGRNRASNGKNVHIQPQETDTIQGIFGYFPTLKEMENYLVNEALRRSEQKQGIAASLLGITRQALNKRLIRKNGNGSQNACSDVNSTTESAMKTE
jgi:DNA-binding NtrC family response regulator